jgi:hypothetical protein
MYLWRGEAGTFRVLHRFYHIGNKLLNLRRSRVFDPIRAPP